jgi:hypothetical protein
MARVQKRGNPRQYWHGKGGKGGKGCARIRAHAHPRSHQENKTQKLFLAYTENTLATLATLATPTATRLPDGKGTNPHPCHPCHFSFLKKGIEHER